MDAYRPTLIHHFSAGAQTAAAGKFAWTAPTAGRILEVHASVGTAPTTSTFILDVNIAGTTIFTTQASRPIIPIAGTAAVCAAAPTNVKVTEGQRVSIDVDQIGSGTAGADLAVTIVFVPSEFV